MGVTNVMIKELALGTRLRLTSNKIYVIEVATEGTTEVHMDWGRGRIHHTLYYQFSLPSGVYCRGNTDTNEELAVGLVPIFSTHQGWLLYLGCLTAIDIL